MNYNLCIISVVQIMTVAGISTAQKVIGYVNLGCFREDGQDMTDYVITVEPTTYEKCLSVCMEKGYKFTGLRRTDEKNVECRCGNTYGARGKLNKDKCLFPCPGNGRQVCGGGNASSILFGYEGIDESYPGVNSASIVILVSISLWSVVFIIFAISFIVSLCRALLAKND